MLYYYCRCCCIVGFTVCPSQMCMVVFLSVCSVCVSVDVVVKCSTCMLKDHNVVLMCECMHVSTCAFVWGVYMLYAIMPTTSVLHVPCAWEALSLPGGCALYYQVHTLCCVLCCSPCKVVWYSDSTVMMTATHGTAVMRLNGYATEFPLCWNSMGCV